MKINLNNIPFIRYFFRYRFYTGYFLGIITWLLIESIKGIVEDTAVKFWSSTLVPWLIGKDSISNLLILTIIVIVAIISAVISKLFAKNNQEFYNSITDKSSLVEYLRIKEISGLYLLFDRITHLIQDHLSSTPNEENQNEIISEFFLSIFRTFNPRLFTGGGIILPESEGKEWLYFWKMAPDNPISPKKFYIGNEKEGKNPKFPRGIAGNVFLDGKPRFANISDPETAESDSEDYHKFDMAQLGQPRYIVPYSSFVCLPIFLNKTIIGVLSIECQKIGIFNHMNIELLRPISDQLGTILFLFCKDKIYT